MHCRTSRAAGDANVRARPEHPCQLFCDQPSKLGGSERLVFSELAIEDGHVDRRSMLLDVALAEWPSQQRGSFEESAQRLQQRILLRTAAFAKATKLDLVAALRHE